MTSQDCDRSVMGDKRRCDDSVKCDETYLCQKNMIKTSKPYSFMLISLCCYCQCLSERQSISLQKLRVESLVRHLLSELALTSTVFTLLIYLSCKDMIEWNRDGHALFHLFSRLFLRKTFTVTICTIGY